jgi:hypothetical protein
MEQSRETLARIIYSGGISQLRLIGITAEN